MLIAVLHLTRQREGLAGNLPGSFPGAKPPRPLQAPQVSPLPVPAEHHGQFLGMQRTLHLDSLAHAFATRYLHTLRPPAPLRRSHRCFPRPGCPPLNFPSSGGRAPRLPGPVGTPRAPTPGTAGPESRERALGLCGGAELSAVCRGDCLPQHVCRAVIYFTPYD